MRTINDKQIKALVQQMRETYHQSSPGKTEEEIDKMILEGFFLSFCNDKISREDLTNMTAEMGYVVRDDVLDQVEKDKAEMKGR